MGNKTIWKYPVRITDRQQLMIPADARFLHVAEQDSDDGESGSEERMLQMWFMVDPENDTVPVNLHIYGTGHPIDRDDLFHAGTVQIRYSFLDPETGQHAFDRIFVWHIFLEPQESA